MLNTLERNILTSWKQDVAENPDLDPEEYLLDIVGIETQALSACFEYLRLMEVNDCGDAIQMGFDDISGITFFKLVHYLVLHKNLYTRMLETG